MGNDIFISYKWARYSETAIILKNWLHELGVHVWIDKNEINQKVILPQEDLKSKLKSAALNSKLMVFFETWDYAQIDPESHESSTRFNWQIFERQFVTEVLFIIPAEGFYDYLQNSKGDLFPFRYTTYLAYLLAFIIGIDHALLSSFWTKHFSQIAFSQSDIESYAIWPFHDRCLYPFLPPIIDPNNSSLRSNTVPKGFIKGRTEIEENHKYSFFEDQR